MNQIACELYIHIPFCVRKCGYCDFLSFPAGEAAREQYLSALAEEIREAGASFRSEGAVFRKAGASFRSEGAVFREAGASFRIDGAATCGDGDSVCGTIGSIFIGGGTPSVLAADQISRLMEQIYAAFPVQAGAEISIEANPGTVDLDKLNAFRSSGINRISIGCQSMHDHELARMGRIHDRAAFLHAFENTRAAGFDNINLDLISALPGQHLSDWEETLRTAATLAPEHISAYSLILEEGTPFFDQRDTLDLPDEDTERDMYEQTASILADYGYQQYELSNYAKPGYQCRHNVGYWTGVPYLGLGLGAASYWFAEPGMIRFRNQTDFKDYCVCCTGRKPGTSWIGHPLHEEITPLTRLDLQAEFMILGLRMTEGVREDTFFAHFGTDVDAVYGEVLRKYSAAGLLQRREGRIALTARGRSLANLVMAEFL